LSGPDSGSPPGGATVAAATFELLRRLAVGEVFANPGSTEVPLLAAWPSDLRFILGLHEGSVVGIATGFALAAQAPACVLLHTTAGLGNATGALATARVNRSPLLVIVGQQDRRHLALEPFLAGRLAGLGGEYPVWVDQPVRAADVPGAIARAYHEALTARGPALVIVPMDDWEAPAPQPHEVIGPVRLLRARRVAGDDDLDALAALLDDAQAPALVVGAGADEPRTWSALVALAERLSCPVWQEAFSARVAFPADHPSYAGVLPAERSRLREALAGRDVVLAVGAPVFRQYAYAPGPLTVAGTRVALVTDDPVEAHRSPTDLTLLADPAPTCEALLARVRARTEPTHAALGPPPRLAPPGVGEPLLAGHVFDALAEHLPPEAIVFEETPSSRPELHRRLPIRRSLGFVSAAMGGLGFALPAAIGARMASPDRPVTAVLGDGSSLYAIQGLWSAVEYSVGVLFIVLVNGRYAIMDRLAELAGSSPAWPAFENVEVASIARGFGCEAAAVETPAQLHALLAEICPGLATRTSPILVTVAVGTDRAFAP
jgi:benzoylformate decarboxylase